MTYRCDYEPRVPSPKDGTRGFLRFCFPGRFYSHFYSRFGTNSRFFSRLNCGFSGTNHYILWSIEQGAQKRTFSKMYK